MSATHPHLARSVSFWLLLVGSLATLGAGIYVLVTTLGGMDARLIDGSATTSDVYVGQIWAVLGAILIGAGLIGLALAATLAALRTLMRAPRPAVDVTAEAPVAALPAVEATGAMVSEPLVEAPEAEAPHIEFDAAPEAAEAAEAEIIEAAPESDSPQSDSPEQR